MSRVKHARELEIGDIVSELAASPIEALLIFDSGVRAMTHDGRAVRWFEPLQAVLVLNDCDSCEHRVHEGSCVTDCPCRRGCPACAGHGVIGTSQGDRPCLICHPPTA